MCSTRSPGTTSSTSPPTSLLSGYAPPCLPFILSSVGCWVRSLTVSVSLGQGYPVSKALVEKAPSRFAEEHGKSLVTVCPVVTVGAAPAPSARTSVPNCLSLLSGEAASKVEPVLSRYRPGDEKNLSIFSRTCSCSFSRHAIDLI